MSRILSKYIPTGDAPTTFAAALGPLGSLDVTPLLAYTLQNISVLRFVLVGVVLIVLMHRRPTGLLGHRKEVASSIDLLDREPRQTPGDTPTAADGGGRDD